MPSWKECLIAGLLSALLVAGLVVWDHFAEQPVTDLRRDITATLQQLQQYDKAMGAVRQYADGSSRAEARLGELERLARRADNTALGDALRLTEGVALLRFEQYGQEIQIGLRGADEQVLKLATALGTSPVYASCTGMPAAEAGRAELRCALAPEVRP
ncbi:MAG: hypothetical protein JXR96_11925 [Deltaproteobacteria bacterium]|nr:hypothetical protein [Deltaproteobacteria bacterium]